MFGIANIPQTTSEKLIVSETSLLHICTEPFLGFSKVDLAINFSICGVTMSIVLVRMIKSDYLLVFRRDGEKRLS